MVLGLRSMRAILHVAFDDQTDRFLPSHNVADGNFATVQFARTDVGVSRFEVQVGIGIRRLARRLAFSKDGRFRKLEAEIDRVVFLRCRRSTVFRCFGSWLTLIARSPAPASATATARPVVVGSGSWASLFTATEVFGDRLGFIFEGNIIFVPGPRVGIVFATLVSMFVSTLATFRRRTLLGLRITATSTAAPATAFAAGAIRAVAESLLSIARGCVAAFDIT